MKSECQPDMSYHYNLSVTSATQLLMYNMVPKCGSRGIRAILRSLAPELNYSADIGSYIYPAHLTSFHHHKKVALDIMHEIELRYGWNHKHVYYRHLHFMDFSSNHSSKYSGIYYTNVIRDPVEHYISWYYFRRFGQNGVVLGPLDLYLRKIHNGNYYSSEEWKKLKSMTFEDCVETNHTECLHHNFTYRMIPFFCGNDDYCLFPSQNSLNQAKKNVIRSFPVVGYLENLSEYFELAEVIFPQFFTGSTELYKKNLRNHQHIINKSTWRYKLEPSNRSKSIMAKRMGLEYAFYNWIKQRFYCMYHHYVANGKTIADNRTTVSIQ